MVAIVKGVIDNSKPLMWHSISPYNCIPLTSPLLFELLPPRVVASLSDFLILLTLASYQVRFHAVFSRFYVFFPPQTGHYQDLSTLNVINLNFPFYV